MVLGTSIDTLTFSHPKCFHILIQKCNVRLEEHMEMQNTELKCESVKGCHQHWL